jgi:NAD(P)-dependent dehydrogenase (short-subunit alcohol dehydrogenase family)
MVRTAGGEMTSVAPVDLTGADDVARWVDVATSVYGGVDVLYNNASRAWVGPWEELTFEIWRDVMRYELDIVYLR